MAKTYISKVQENFYFILLRKIDKRKKIKGKEKQLKKNEIFILKKKRIPSVINLGIRRHYFNCWFNSKD